MGKMICGGRPNSMFHEFTKWNDIHKDQTHNGTRFVFTIVQQRRCDLCNLVEIRTVKH